jgi:uncharacterized protein (TIGR02145 family)
MKVILLSVLIISLTSCKKESTTTNTPSQSNNDKNLVKCLDNIYLNFSSIGKPVGNFSDCIKDVDGNVYKTVTIGNQTWMAENLKTSKYNDGTTIPNIIDNAKWLKDTSGAWCYYKNDTTYNSKYGKLYNWYAVNKTSNGFKNVCPIGWHVPTEKEEYDLMVYLGGGKLAGGKMKEVGTTSWKEPNSDATNESLFTGIPCGQRDFGGTFNDIGNSSYWWTSSLNTSSNANLQVIGYGLRSSGIFSIAGFKYFGYSIRCLKD